VNLDERKPSNLHSGGNCQASRVAAVMRQLRHTFSPQFRAIVTIAAASFYENEADGCPDSSNGWRKTTNPALLPKSWHPAEHFAS
jgi:hypothetical protein